MTERLDFTASVAKLGRPDAAAPPRMPHPDDDHPTGLEFFRTRLDGEDCANLTIPRTFFSRSGIVNTSFANTDLSESWMCWNNFTDVTFDHADLTRCDLRASQFERCTFRGADLAGADLRGLDLASCDLSDATMTGAVCSKDLRAQGVLSKAQIADIDWRDDAGEEPAGG